jgi:hypothetical protein
MANDAELRRKDVITCTRGSVTADISYAVASNYLRTLSDTECGSLSASAAALEVVRWCAMLLPYLHSQAMGMLFSTIVSRGQRGTLRPVLPLLTAVE